jgi:hypothetical protein
LQQEQVLHHVLKQAASAQLGALTEQALAGEEAAPVQQDGIPSQEAEDGRQPCPLEASSVHPEEAGDDGAANSQPPPIGRYSSMGCGSESEVLAIDDMLKVLDSFWSAPARANGKSADADASIASSTSKT